MSLFHAEYIVLAIIMITRTSPRLISVIIFFIAIAVAFLYIVEFSQNMQLNKTTETDVGGQDSRILCSGKPCNVIFIIADTLGARHMGLYGYERDTTPFIDEFFGQQGVVFQNAWSASTWSALSFASLYVSKYPSDITLGELLDPRQTKSFLDILRSAKVPVSAFIPLARGYGTNSTTLSCRRANSILCASIVRIFEPSEIKSSIRDGEPQFLEVAQLISDMEGFSDSPDTPFFLLLHNYTVHSPYDPPEPYRFLFAGPSVYPGSITNAKLNQAASGEIELAPEEKKRWKLQYDQEIRYFDDIFKGFIEQLPQSVISNTVIILTSDHGEAFGEHGGVGHGGVPYEEEVHVPLLIKAPGFEPRTIAHPVSIVDFAPTILNIFGLSSPDTFTGQSLLPLLGGEDIPNVIIRSESDLGALSWLFGEEDFYQYATSNPTKTLAGTKASVAVRLDEWKLIKKPNNQLELYNLRRDPKESKNLIPLWDSLNEAEQQKILPLFFELGVEPPK